MPLEVICLCTYLVTENYGLWRPQDHNASKFVKALKGETLNGYAYVPVLGVQRHLDNSNLDESIVWFGDLVASYMQQHGMNPPFVLVPVPNSSSTTKDSSSRPRTRKLARAIAAKIGQGTTVADCLRWKQNLGSARKGTGVATRDAATLYSNLAVIEKIDGSNPYILIDDAIASGGHLQACAAMLAKRGATVVSAFCGGRTVHEPPDSAFAPLREELADYIP